MITIGKVAEQTGATRRAIRLYESQGLIPPPQRRGSYRVYSDKEVMAIALIKRAQEGGFSLAELKGLVNRKLRDNRFPLQLAADMIEQKRQALQREIDVIKRVRRQLDGLEQEVIQRYGNTV